LELNFFGHLVVGFFTFLVLNWLLPLPQDTVVLGFVVTVFFALLPDVDSDISRINNFIEVALLVFAMYCFYEFSLSKAQDFFVFGETGLGVLLATKFLKHRGWMHTVQAGLLLSLPLYFFNHLLFWFAFAGFLSHLVVDGRL